MNNKLFYKDIKLNIEKSYADLVDDLKKETDYSPYCRTDSYYNIFKKIVLSLILGEEIVLLDSDFTDEEVSKLIGPSSAWSEITTKVMNLEDLTVEKLNEAIYNGEKTWKITLFTSGTTGLPKKVSHSLKSVSRFVKKSERHSTDTWGFSYNPTHMAGLQVFFQALLNRNSIIRLFGLDRESILSLIDGSHISNISATPTFYRLLLPVDRSCISVQRITSGGEKFDNHTICKLEKLFPNAKITNVYASTEAGSLFAAKGDIFTIKNEMTSFVKIENKELFLHKSLMGESVNMNFLGDWYATGDLIDLLTENPSTFKFISRKNEMINVGGYKVNPTEVEEAIREYSGIKDAFVYGKKNSLLGNVICCEVIRESESITEPLLRNYLKNKLQEFKIPRMMKFVDRLHTTRTGKLSRTN